MNNDYNINKSIQIITQYMAESLMRTKGCTENQAIQFLITTHTYQLLRNKKTKLYAESPEYVMDMLKDEISQNWESWYKI